MGRTPRGQTRERIYQYMRERLSAGDPPTVREVQRAFGFRSVQTARQHLEALVSEGRLEVARGHARGYRLPESWISNRSEGWRVRVVPVLGRVSAGPLSTAVEDLEGYVSVEVRGAGGEYFALRVRGDSMVGAAILPGDLVVVKRQPDAENGDIVVALVGEEATVKRLKKVGGRVELHAENPAYDPIVLEGSEVEVLGKVVEVRRRLSGW